MIPKSEQRFSEKIMLDAKTWSEMTKVASLQERRFRTCAD
jgi:hypothetical protein